MGPYAHVYTCGTRAITLRTAASRVRDDCGSYMCAFHTLRVFLSSRIRNKFASDAIMARARRTSVQIENNYFYNGVGN